MEKIKIGIVGSGQVAQALGAGFATFGHEVLLGTREPDKLAEWKMKTGRTSINVGSVHDALAFSDLVVLAIKGIYAEEVVRENAAHFSGKTVIDATNPIEASAPENGVLRFFTNQNESLLERLQKLVPAANFVKAFNSVGSHLMVSPIFEDGTPTMFIAGNSSDSKIKVAKLLAQLGWDVNDLGKAEAARPIESLCILWCLPGFTQNNWNHAIKFLKK